MKKNKLGLIYNIIITVIAIVMLILFLNNNSKLTDLTINLNEIKGENKKAITAEQFKDKIETKGFDIATVETLWSKEDIKNNGIKQGYLTQNVEDIEYRINFFSFKDENSAKYWLYDGINSIRQENTGNLVETTEKSMNHTTYIALNNGTYKTIRRIGNTLIWATINEEDKQAVINLLSEFGY